MTDRSTLESDFPLDPFRRTLEGHSTSAEQRTLDALIEANPEWAADAERLKTVWTLGSQATEPFDTGEGWRVVEQAVSAQRRNGRSRGIATTSRETQTRVRDHTPTARW